MLGECAWARERKSNIKRGRERDRQREWGRELPPNLTDNVMVFHELYLLCVCFQMFCLFVLTRSFVCVCLNVRTRKHAFVPLSHSHTPNREWCLFQSYNRLNVILNATQHKALCFECGKNVANNLIEEQQPKKQRKTLKLYTQTNTNERKQYTHVVWAYACCGQMSSIWQWVCALKFFICTIFPFSFALSMLCIWSY